MADPDIEFRNILVIDFGQLGDVILSLPALKAIRCRFPDARITLLIGKPGADIVRIAGVSDEQILVDRVELRDSNPVWSIHQLYKLVRKIRGLKFDFIIDLNSFYETNIIGYLSGARHRLYASRKKRSLDRLARFPTLPPKEDKSMHLTDRYFDVLQPLGISGHGPEIRVSVPEADVAETKRLFDDLGIAGKQLVGLFVGAGHPSRCWKLEKFAELARRLLNDPDRCVLVFIGPEEVHLVERIGEIFPPEVIVIEKIKLRTLMAAASMLDVFVTNDTGPMHLAAVAGAPIVLILDKRAPTTFLPLTEKLCVLNGHLIDEITVNEVLSATLGMMAVHSL